MTKEFLKGQRCYDIDGNIYKYICKVQDGHAVRKMIEYFECDYDSNETNDYYLGQSILIDEVYHQPPKQMVDSSITEAKEELEKIKSEIRSLSKKKFDLSSEIDKIERELQAKKAELSKKSD